MQPASGRLCLAGMMVFSLIVAAAIYGSFDEIGFDPAFPRHDTLGDFGSFYESGGAALRGDNPYGIYPLTYFSAAGKGQAAINLNAPFSVVLFEPLAHVEPVTAARVWNIASTLAYVATVLILHASYPATRAPGRVVWAFGVSSFWGTLALGQIYAFMALASSLAWVLLGKKHAVGPGVLIGFVAAIKPTFLVWPALLFVGGYKRAALVAFGSAAVFGALPVLQLGPGVYQQWSEVALGTQVSGAPTNGSLFGLAERLGVGWIGVYVSVALLAVMTLWAWRVRPAVEQLNGAALATTLLAAPAAWTGYALFTLPAFFARQWSAVLASAGLVVLIPVGSVLLPIAPTSPFTALFVGSAYTWALLLILADCVFDSSRAGTPGGLALRVANLDWRRRADVVQGYAPRR